MKADTVAPVRGGVSISISILLFVISFSTLVVAQTHSIVSITVCSAAGPINKPASCPQGTIDTELPVLAPVGGSINNYGGLGTLADEHSTIFPPNALPWTPGYTFFVAARTNLNTISSGVVALTGGSGPNANGQWTLDFAPGYGLYAPLNPPGSRNGQVFVSPVEHRLCPSAASIQQQDPTFDLNYADPGSIVLDPTNPFDLVPGNLLMVYEGTNRCIGLTNGDNVAQNNSFYSTIAVATSFDFGHTWPAYRYNLNAFGYPNFPLPSQNTSFGPEQAQGASGKDVCVGNNCWLTQLLPNPNYGRYAVLRPQASITDVLQNPYTIAQAQLKNQLGDSVPSAFVDDIGYWFGAPRPVYLYEIHNYATGDAQLNEPALPNGQNSDLMISRAQLNGGTAQLAFQKWYNGKFLESGMGGFETPIFPHTGDFTKCEADGQLKTMGVISFVDTTQQYLMTFVCISQGGNPATGLGYPGAAWFFSTNSDLSRPDLWTPPQQIVGTWQPFDLNISSCNAYHGWYPSYMSLGAKSGHLGNTGYIFYMSGCTGSGDVGGRQYSTRAFTIVTN